MSADFARLGEQVAEAAGADRIHVDVMDGHFVPNLTIGPVVVNALRKVTALPLDVHMMVAEPDRWLDAFADAGGASLIPHVEATPHVHRTVERIRDLGRRVGVALNPATPVSALEELVAELDLLLVMTVDPGFGGQELIPGTLPKIRRIRDLLDRSKPECEVHADGGIHPMTAPAAVEAGACVLVAGAAIFEDPAGIHSALDRLRRSIDGGRGARARRS